MAIGSTEIVILVVFGILIFGANKIPQLARGVGRAKGEFQMGMKEAWLDLAASGANLPFELADREGRFDDMMQMLGGGEGADEKQNQMRGYLINHMRITRVWTWSRRRPCISATVARFSRNSLASY